MKKNIVAIIALILIYLPTSIAYAEGVPSEKNYQLNSFDYEKLWLETKGAGVRVCIIDTGFTNLNEEFLPRISPGYSVMEDGSTTDNNGHGTAISYIIGGPVNSISGVVGIAPEVEIVPIKVMDENGIVSATNTAKGLSWALTHGCEVINISLTGEQDSELLRLVVKEVVNKDIPIIASAGNGFATGNPLPFPASYADVFSVSAVSNKYELTEYGNHGEYLSFVELGNSILAPNLMKGLYLWSGTSFATAIVTGKIALIKALFPELTVEELKYFLSVTAYDLESPGRDDTTGFGAINLDKAVALLKSKYNILEKIQVSEKTGKVELEYRYPVVEESEFFLYVNGKEASYIKKGNIVEITSRFPKNIRLNSESRYYTTDLIEIDYSRLLKLKRISNKIAISNLPKNSTINLYYGNKKLNKVTCNYECVFSPGKANRLKVSNQLYNKYFSIPKKL